MRGFSIIICSYEPIDRNFIRLLNAIQNFNKTNLNFEVIIVDNHSKNSIEGRRYVDKFLRLNRNSKIIIEKKLGLTAARMAGIKTSQFDWLIFFDDDNEPEIDYLSKASELVNQFPQVGAWGPGCVNVEFESKVNPWLKKNKEIFQQRNDAEMIFDNQRHWQYCYPYGTGLVINKKVAVEYSKRVSSKRYTLTDRNGKSLSSGGDVQLVFTAIQLDFSAGVTPVLRMKHLIDESKTKYSYLCKLVYGTASAYVIAYNQVFQNDKIQFSPTDNVKILRLITHCLVRIVKTLDIKIEVLSLISSLGEVNSRYVAYNMLDKPALIKLIEKIIRY